MEAPKYRSELYHSDCRDRILPFIREYPFAVLIPDGTGGASFAYLPLLLDPTSPEPALFGHIDNENPFLPQTNGATLHAVFLGPNGYISPRDYASRQLPTWNYAVVRISGPSRRLPDDDKLSCMARMADLLEEDGAARYRPAPDDDGIRALLDRISFFRIDVEEAQGIFKFSQDKDDEDRLSAGSSLLRKIGETQSRVLSRLIDGLEARDPSTTPLRPDRGRRA